MMYLFLIIADILLALYFVCTKKYQLMRGVSAKASYFSVAVIGFFTALLFFIINGFKINVSLYSIIMCVALNICTTLYTLIGRFVIQKGSLALYTLFLMSGGMVVPYVWGLLFLDEPFSWMGLCGILLIIFAIILSNTTKIKINYKFILLCFAIFFINGMTSVISKLHQTSTRYETISTTDFVIIGGIVKLIIGTAMYFIERKKNDVASDIHNGSIISVLILLLIATCASGLSSILQLYTAKTVPATVLYPFITGGSIIFTSVAGVILYKEKLTKEIISSIAICFVGTLLFL